MGWPYINQLSSPTADAQPDEDRNQNCVAAFVAMVAWHFTDKPIYPDDVKDAVYGQGYLGPQAASRYVTFLRSRGIDLKPFNASAAGLIAELKDAVNHGRPCAITVPTRWMENVDSGSTHVMTVISYTASDDTFNVADPWGGVARRLTAGYLQPRLRMGQIWEASMAGDTTGLGAGMAYFVLQHGLAPVRVPEIKGLLARDRSFAVVGQSILYYDPATKVTDDQHAGDVVVELYTIIHTAQGLSDEATAAIAAVSALKKSLGVVP